jgi:acyl CoA:acetate/3-ketoacid CoA transferase beta subunit
MLKHSRRTFVDELDFRTTAGHGVTCVVTDLGILEPRSGELTLTALHPGVAVDDVRAATGWELAVADDLATTEPPTAAELEALRSLKPATEVHVP